MKLFHLRPLLGQSLDINKVQKKLFVCLLIEEVHGSKQQNAFWPTEDHNRHILFGQN
jgi:hypothetical protein